MVDVPDDNAPFRKVIDSTLMLTVARFAMPLIVGALGWMFSTMMSDLKTGQKEGISELKNGQQQIWLQMGKLSDVQTTSSVSIGVLSSKVDGSLKQLDHLQIQVDSIPKH